MLLGVLLLIVECETNPGAIAASTLFFQIGVISLPVSNLSSECLTVGHSLLPQTRTQ